MNHIQELLHQQKDALVFLIFDPEDDFEGDVEQIPEEGIRDSPFLRKPLE